MITTSIKLAADYLEKNEVVAIPTETVYGLAANIFSESAVQKIFEIKKRPFFNPLIVHIASIDDLPKVASEIPDMAYELASHFWPGPLTMIFKKQEAVPSLVTGGKDTVAVRIPNHSIALELLQKVGFPLAAPSANPFSSISPTTAVHVEKYFKEELGVILDGGKCQQGIESTIIGFDAEGVVVYRLGSLAIESIEAIVGPVKIKSKDNKAPIAPGMLERHYAPKTPFVLTSSIEQAVKLYSDKKVGVITFQEATTQKVKHLTVLSPKGNLAEAAQKLYATLHKLDEMNLDVIIAETFPDKELGKSINDRLTRASKTK
jgi:L-threonylcarbamoyladenylate synthase